MKMVRFYLIALSVVLIVAPVRAADSMPEKDLPDLIQHRYDSLTTFQAAFEQELTNVSSGEVEIRRGNIWYKQPSQVRWETQEPTKELLVVGSKYAWDYIEEDGMALKYDVATLFNSKTILRFLSGQANIKDDFVVKNEWDGADDVRAKWGKGLIVLQLIPKEAEPGMVLAFIGVESKTSLLKQVMIVDFYGNGNEVRLSKVETDVELPAKMFTFEPPSGVTVEDNTEGS